MDTNTVWTSALSEQHIRDDVLRVMKPYFNGFGTFCRFAVSDDRHKQIHSKIVKSVTLTIAPSYRIGPAPRFSAFRSKSRINTAIDNAREEATKYLHDKTGRAIASHIIASRNPILNDENITCPITDSKSYPYKEPCADCQGYGKITCDTCGGSPPKVSQVVNVTCDRCGGRGFIKNPYVAAWSEADGTGFGANDIMCGSCIGGKKTATRNIPTCRACNNYGYFRCGSCNGKKRNIGSTEAALDVQIQVEFDSREPVALFFISGNESWNIINMDSEDVSESPNDEFPYQIEWQTAGYVTYNSSEITINDKKYTVFHFNGTLIADEILDDSVDSILQAFRKSRFNILNKLKIILNVPNLRRIFFGFGWNKIKKRLTDGESRLVSYERVEVLERIVRRTRSRLFMIFFTAAVSVAILYNIGEF